VGGLRQVARRHVCHFFQTQSLKQERLKWSTVSNCATVYGFE
jgi:hypothetical protein